MIPRATYRLQFTRDFPFAAAERIIPYLSELGISHVYASPITQARSGSTHGYDVVDPTRINPELGGEEGFRALVEALKAQGIGIIIDIVPNHMGVAGGENRYWNDVLKRGRNSVYARYFDIDWSGPVILPILGATLAEAIEAGNIEVVAGDDPHLLLYGEQRLPLRPDIAPSDDLGVLISAQHYRLVHWRTANDSLNWRRFFSINDLAGLRIEDDSVFEETHALYFDLFRDGLIDGVRIDHVDGLTDPAGYCRKLRARFDAIKGGDQRAYIVVEKILAADEELPRDWDIDGTSGYDFMRDVTALLHDPSGEAALKALWAERDPDHVDPNAVVLQARKDMLSWQFEAQLEACVAAFMALTESATAEQPELAALTRGMMRRAIVRLMWVFPVYRTYGDGREAPACDATARQTAWDAVQAHIPPGEAHIAAAVLAWLAGEGPGDATLSAEAVRRFQQLSAPIAAKGVEDTAFYRYAPLLSANDVGSAPEQFAISAAEFHRRAIARTELIPHAMLASATHDHKRGEDVRARLAVLSCVPDLWRETLQRWAGIEQDMGACVHPADRYQIFQTLFGAWPEVRQSVMAAEFRERIGAWLEKSLREARLRSSWEEPDSDYEAAAQNFLMQLLDNDGFTQDMEDFARRLAPAAEANSLAQTALKFCIPGVPDTYQGTELQDFSLVDPDNRRPVDYDLRLRLLDEMENDQNRKLLLVRKLLQLRKSSPNVFAYGSYDILQVSGDKAGHVLAFERRCDGETLTCAILFRGGEAIIDAGGLPDRDWWGDTKILGDTPINAATIFAHAPYFVNLDKSV